MPTHEFDQFLDQRQPDTRAAGRPRHGAVQLLETVENKGELFRRNALAGVLDLAADEDTAWGFLVPVHGHRYPAVVGEFDGVVHQAGQDLAVAHRITGHLRPCRPLTGEVQNQLQPMLVGQVTEAGQAVLGQFPRIEQTTLQQQFALVQSRDIQDVIDQCQQIFGGLPGGVQVIGLVGSERLLGDQVHHRQNAVQGGTQFVAHQCQELRLGQAGRLGLFPGILR